MIEGVAAGSPVAGSNYHSPSREVAGADVGTGEAEEVVREIRRETRRRFSGEQSGCAARRASPPCVAARECLVGGRSRRSGSFYRCAPIDQWLMAPRVRTRTPPLQGRRG